MKAIEKSIRLETEDVELTESEQEDNEIDYSRDV